MKVVNFDSRLYSTKSHLEGQVDLGHCPSCRKRWQPYCLHRWPHGRKSWMRGQQLSLGYIWKYTRTPGHWIDRCRTLPMLITGPTTLPVLLYRSAMGSTGCLLLKYQKMVHAKIATHPEVSPGYRKNLGRIPIVVELEFPFQITQVG